LTSKIALSSLSILKGKNEMQTLFTTKNLKLFAISLALLILGYVFLAQGPVENPISKTIAPLIIVGVYCVLIPIAIMAKGSNTKK
jgi:hypothetical protein